MDTIASRDKQISSLENERDQDGDLILRLNDDLGNLKGKCAGLQGELSETQSLYEQTVQQNKKRYDDTVSRYEGDLKELREEKLDEKVRYETEIQNLTEQSETQSRHWSWRLKTRSAPTALLPKRPASF
eukprot:TRINITY_DN3896_c0_g1_i1.p1 TRINITY_DN3896_c0_g1~~TRINITY_DN3896_c0_g1_i1.p1  ORF type:complete len:129 (+),score=11.04 TRINITY_DN3896_c0_g1_i1:256-642(+)